jgi:hypothetical protein
MKYSMFMIFLIILFAHVAIGAHGNSSEDTQICIECHSFVTPGIVAGWEKSRHAKVTPSQGLKMTGVKKIVSADKIPERLSSNTVGCAECHTINPGNHKDTFQHNGFEVHVVVTPKDCATCHPVEVDQYGKNLMSNAYGNLQKNPLYRDLINSINGIQSFGDMKISHKRPDVETDADSCLFCHGTVVEVKGMKTRDTVEGEMSFPVLKGWPNQGSGRINPDGSKGSCTVCHTRHQFAVEMARKPHTCSECHKGPDVPAYKVYTVSKHGNIHSAMGHEWNFRAIPWTVGKDFTAPTCATCHVSLLVSEDGDVIAKRTHQMSDRLSWRIFGLIYGHPYPKSPDTTIIKNKAGLPLPTELTGEPVAEYLIDLNEQTRRRETMKKVCLACHGRNWVDGHFGRLKNTIKTTNEMTLTATKILVSAWDQGVVKGLAQKDSIFNETLEKKWVEQWLFYANSTRFASAMAGADDGAFANGRWYMSKNIQDMMEWLELKLKKK